MAAAGRGGVDRDLWWTAMAVTLMHSGTFLTMMMRPSTFFFDRAIGDADGGDADGGDAAEAERGSDGNLKRVSTTTRRFGALRSAQVLGVRRRHAPRHLVTKERSALAVVARNFLTELCDVAVHTLEHTPRYLWRHVTHLANN